MGGSKDGRGVRWYSGRGGRFEKPSMADAVAIWLLPGGQRKYCLTRHEAGVGPSRRRITKAQWRLTSNTIKIYKQVYIDNADGESSEDSGNQRQRSV